MNTRVSFGNAYRSEVGEDLFNTLVRIYPEGQRGDRWGLTLPDGDPRIEAAVHAVEEAGIGRRTGLVGHPWPKDRPTLRFYKHRTYTASDFRDCELIQIIGTPSLRAFPLDRDGRIAIYRSSAKRNVDFAGDSDFEAVLVPRRIRTVLEEAGFAALRFNEAVLIERARSGGRKMLAWGDLDPWYELRGNYLLPPLSPRCDLCDREGQPYVRGESKTCVLREDFYVFPELWYERQAIEEMPPFDIAESAEIFNTTAPVVQEQMRAKVVSKRFYDFCCKHGLRADWRPVRILD